VEPKLPGFWAEVDAGSPENTYLGFTADGTGWLQWESWSGAFAAERFEWHTPEPGLLVVRWRLEISGTWHNDRPDVVESRKELDATAKLAWEIDGQGRLKLDRPMDEVYGGTLFEFIEGGGEDPFRDSAPPPT
jgi:hypothetical protein